MFRKNSILVPKYTLSKPVQPRCKTRSYVTNLDRQARSVEGRQRGEGGSPFLNDSSKGIIGEQLMRVMVVRSLVRRGHK